MFYTTISQLPNKLHGHLATPLEYVIPMIRWSLGCTRIPNHIYLTLYCLKIPPILIKLKKSRQMNAERI